MKLIENLINYNQEKLGYLNEYLAANEMIETMSRDKNFTAIKGLVDKKRGIVASIHVVDDKVIQGIKKLKDSEGIDDLAELKSDNKALLINLKQISGQVLQKMVEVKTSDEAVKDFVEEAFNQVKVSNSHIDKNKLYHYTNQYFDKK